MTDERGGRYFREARFFLAGDKVVAQSHIGEARSLMGYMRDQLALGGPAIQVQYTTLQDGTQIKATMMNGQYQAQIVSPVPPQTLVEAPGCFIHMDSGIADVGVIAPEGIDRFENATLYVGSKLADNRFWGDVSVPDGVGHTAIPVGAIGEDKIESPPNVTGQEIECLQYVEPDRPEGISDEAWAHAVEQGKATLYAKKVRVARSFSSYFSGKMRLYIQAIDSRRLFAEDTPSPDLRLSASNPPVLEAQMYDENGDYASYPGTGNAMAVVIANNSTVSTGIYTDSNNHYWYIQLVDRGSTMDVTVTKMQLSVCGLAAAKAAKESATQDERDRFEALALSTGTARSDVSFTISDFCFSPAFSQTLCYGWTFKWDGSEAHIVLHNRTTSSRFIAYHMKVSLHRNDAITFPETSQLTLAEQERARWTINGEIVEGGKEWRSKTGKQNIWVPVFGLYMLREWADTADETPCYGDAPVYCFYDRYDELQILRFNGVDHEPYVDTQYPPCYSAEYDWAAGVSSSFTATRHEYSVRMQGSFTCGPVEVSGEYSSATEANTDFRITETGTSDYQYAPHTTAAAGSPCAPNDGALAYKAIIDAPLPFGEPGWLTKRVHGALNQTYDFGLINTTEFISVVVPWGDCAALYLAETGGVARFGHRIVTTNPNFTISEDSVRFNYDGATQVFYPGSASYTWRNVDQSAFGAVNIHSEYDEDNTAGATYKFIGFDGVGRSTDQGEWTDYMMRPALVGLFVPYTFSTFSSAGQADIIGTGFETGGYQLHDRPTYYALMYNRAFIGFA